MGIKIVRENAGLTQTELAEKIGVAQQIVSRWEKGDRKPKLEALQKIAIVCNTNIAALISSHSIKLNRARGESGYAGYAGTCEAIFKQIPAKLVDCLTAGQLAVIAQVINKAYKQGQASTGAECLGDNSVWIESLGKIIEWVKLDNVMTAKVCD